MTESVEKLVKYAHSNYASGKQERSKRYIKMALDLVKKNKVKVPKEVKNSFCKKCHIVWVPDETVTISYDRKNSCLRVKCKCGYTKRL
ncbi:hypothetical protein HZC07_00095 [Candidatus Micrarchaeota archaeon]|nr:hypothetical protein [Candidatus Micrarchaeota archaeon]